MTQQEEQLIQGLIDRVNSTQLQSKDPEAEKAITTALGNNPNALYILCQTVLVQQFAMENSQHELETLRVQMQQLQQQQPPAEEKHTSFLGSIFGKKDEQPQQQGSTGYAPVHDPYGGQQSQYGGTPQQYQQNYPPPQQYAPQGQYGQPYPPQPTGYGYPPQPPAGYGAPPMGGGMFGGGGGGFLAGAAQTAAGVVAGEMAFRALEGVFSGGHERGFADNRPEVINNYYDDNDRGSGDSFGDRLASADDYNGGVSSDIEDRRGESSGFFDGGSDDSNDTSSFDDGGSFDDSGSDDFSGGNDDIS